LIEQCLSDWAVLLTDYWQKTVEKWRFAEVDISGAHINESESRLLSSAKRSSNELDLTLSTTKMFSPLALISALNSLYCHRLLTNVLERT
jgi:hypothetical protein